MGIDNEWLDLDETSAEPQPLRELVGLGPNVTGYPGGYPNGYLQFLQRKGWWGTRRLHLCSGSVADGTTVDIKRFIVTSHAAGSRTVRPTVRADLRHGVPFADGSFDGIYIDPPYSEEKASELYALPLVNVPALLKEAYRVLAPSGYIVILDLRNWGDLRPKGSTWVALHPVNTANRGAKPLRACCVFQKPKDAPIALGAPNQSRLPME